MRLLYMTDTHIRGTSPRSRKDDFQQAMRAKLSEVQEIAQREQVDFILHGGDLFDRPNLSPAIVREFVQLLRRFHTPIYTIAGNHDIYGHNPVTVDRTMLGLLDAFGIVRLVREGERIRLEKDGVVVQLSGQPFHYDIDRREKALDYAVKNEINAHYCLHMVHSMLVDRTLPESVAYTIVHDLWELDSDVDIVFTGHYHAGFPMQSREGKYIINPGALARINNHPSEINRMPQVVLIELTDQIQVRFLPLACAADGEKVLDRSYIETERYRDEQRDQFVQVIQASMADLTGYELNVIGTIEKIAQMEDVDDQVRDEARRRIEREQEEEAMAGER